MRMTNFVLPLAVIRPTGPTKYRKNAAAPVRRFLVDKSGHVESYIAMFAMIVGSLVAMAASVVFTKGWAAALGIVAFLATIVAVMFWIFREEKGAPDGEPVTVPVKPISPPPSLASDQDGHTDLPITLAISALVMAGIMLFYTNSNKATDIAINDITHFLSGGPVLQGGEEAQGRGRNQSPTC